MTRWKPLTLTGWGRNRTAKVGAARPERPRDLDAALADSADISLLARGAGRAYGDAALNDGGHVVLTERLDRILSFDPASGVVVCEPGVTFADLFEIFVPRGFMAPASPGTAFATVGGALAADVHGKNHDRHGSFGDHVEWFDLMLADGSTRRVTAESDAELFAATIGGMGLTGIVRALAFRLLPRATPWVTVHEERIADLDHYLEAFAQVRDTALFSVGWIDALARGGSLGRGILETAEFHDDRTLPEPPRPRRVPLDLPSLALNRLSVRAFNEFYRRRVPAEGRDRLRSFVEFLYPLDAVHDWNRIYGKRGFYQFQCVLPDATARTGLRRLLETISETGNPSFLAVLKTLGHAGRGHISFPMRGHTLALDFPCDGGADELLRRLEAITLDHQGRVYVAKDSLLSRAGFRAMYPDLPRFEAVLNRVDPQARFMSDLARRLGLKGAP
jgi:decaprenylphospho-beta-D-ribofuranose 2-oxidase